MFEMRYGRCEMVKGEKCHVTVKLDVAQFFSFGMIPSMRGDNGGALAFKEANLRVDQ